ncbi:Hypothetical protein A7982_06165 [Minicystis rosea]|nr:Hypothetical protein A7982_06165 [Minicystis rosea]
MPPFYAKAPSGELQAMAQARVSEAALGWRPNVVLRGYDHLRLASYVACSEEAWTELAAMWDDLPADAYMKAPHPGRFRRYGRFSYSRSDDRLVSLAQAPFSQGLDINAYAGGIPRDFAPLTEATIGNPLFEATLRAGIAAFIDVEDARPWEIGVHQIRVVALADQPGAPTPEGLHRDGYDFVAVHLIGRKNIAGGETLLLVDGVERCSLMSEPLETMFIDDVRCMHGASPIQPLDASRLAARDTLIVTFHHVRP